METIGPIRLNAVKHWPFVMAGIFLALTLLIVGELHISQTKLRRASEAKLVADSIRRRAELDDFFREREVAVGRMASSHPISAYLVNRALGMSHQYGLAANLDYIETELTQELMQSRFRGRPIYRDIAFRDEHGRRMVSVGQGRPLVLENVPVDRAGVIVDGSRDVVIAFAPVLHKGHYRGSLVTVTDLDLLAAFLIADPSKAPEHQEFLLADGGRRIVTPGWTSILSRRDARRLERLAAGIPTSTDDLGNLDLGSGFVALRTPVTSHPISILTLVGEAYTYRETGSPWRAYYIGALSVALFVALIGFERMRHRAQRLQTDIADGNRHRQQLEASNTELLAEIARREAVELALSIKNERIKHLAFNDQLTGLSNRAGLVERAQRVFGVEAADWKHGILLFVDLDDFKTLNDTLGHATGDLLLKQTADRLVGCVGDSDIVARFGGDEYILLLTLRDAETVAEAASVAAGIAAGIVDSLGRPYDLRGFEYRCTPSIGVVLFVHGTVDLDELLRYADLAMYDAKSAGRNTFRFFAPELQANLAERAALEADLRCDVRDQNFELHFQPQIDRHGHLIGAEALIRWPHNRRGYVPPVDFIGVAESTGLIQPLGEWVAEAACRQLAAWSTRPELAGLTLSINVSGVQLRGDRFVDHLTKTLERHGIDPGRLKLELTESVLIDRHVEISERMERLRRQGVRFSLDDFGTGYSSLAYLKQLPIEELKIDRSFVQDILVDANDAAIAKTIIALAKTLGLKVLAEGIETEIQRHVLDLMGCDLYQGYLIGRPVPARAFEDYAVEMADTRPMSDASESGGNASGSAIHCFRNAG
ncbi:putative bifunctional diguanylate cyclase/phosphodiesterase [Rhodoplanes sp. SY1]|uniref:putative bifunctional diguanylate cyclase/phosphodiesterase n=1 Tax=Rhodoplanes sp. SY1 TaxID=3166646 RepID=UPI0038B58E53